MIKTINVIQRDIDRGEPASDRCPIARAIRRHLAKGTLVWVTGAPEALIDTRRIHLPYDAMCFVYDFDRNRPVSPFTFTLNIPDEVLRS